MFLVSKLRLCERLAPGLLNTDLKFFSLSRLNRSQGVEENTSEVPINPNYVNKNPRNLEWSGHQYKRFGWNLQYPPKDFYHRCTFRVARNYLEAIVTHSSGEVIVKASTNELPFQQHLYSKRDTSAAINLGKLLAVRCMKAGITHMDYLKSITFDNSQRELAFHKAILESGIEFVEPEFQTRPDNIHGLDYDNPDFYTYKQDVPFPPNVNRIIRKQMADAKDDEN